MGDIRNCIAALSPDSPAVDAFQYRFTEGRFAGHVVGNLMMAATTQATGSFIKAIEQASAMLGARGKVVPPTLHPVKLVSEVDGRRVEGQVAVATSNGRISYVALQPSDAEAYPEAVELLSTADQIVLGPGSLFTSVIPSLLVEEVRRAFIDSKAQKIYVCNIASHGETVGYDACSHLASIYAHLGKDSVDVVVFHEGRPPVTGGTVKVDAEALAGMGVKVVGADLIPDDLSARHEPSLLADILRKL